MRVLYRNTESAETRASHAEMIDDIDKRGLLYPVTVVDGIALYDGAVSYPAIMRAVANKLVEREEAAQS